jgi:lysine 2,3-aminomutase
VERWKQQLSKCFQSKERLPPDFILTEEEKEYFHAVSSAPSRSSGGEGSFCVTPYYYNLSREVQNSMTGANPIRRQFMPTISETVTKPYETADPLFEQQFSPVPKLIHRYRDRVVVLITGMCAVFCRHCFRRYHIGRHTGLLSPSEISPMVEYVEDHPEIKEIILSGGDPLMAEDDYLEAVLTMFRSIEGRHLRIRIATRLPVVLPSRITTELCVLLRRFAPVWMVTQFNHPFELTYESREAVESIVDMGVPLLNQTVLLKGINDSEETLTELFEELSGMRIKPYYLFQGDLAAGTSHFRVPLEKGVQLMDRLRGGLSGLALPTFAVDLPRGGGKVALHRDGIRTKRGGWYHLRDKEGRVYDYPDESV